MASKQNSPSARRIPPRRWYTRRNWNRPELAAPVDVLSDGHGGFYTDPHEIRSKNGILSQQLASALYGNGDRVWGVMQININKVMLNMRTGGAV
jgi:hypothetical protein